MGVPAFLAAVAFGADVAKGFAQYNAEQDQLDAIDTQAKATRLQYIQKTVANYDTIEKLIATQTAQATVRGVGLNSASFNAIQRSTYNVFAHGQQNLNTEEELSTLNDKIEKQNVRDTFMGQIFGDVASAAKDAASFFASVPTGGS